MPVGVMRIKTGYRIKDKLLIKIVRKEKFRRKMKYRLLRNILAQNEIYTLKQKIVGNERKINKQNCSRNQNRGAGINLFYIFI